MLQTRHEIIGIADRLIRDEGYNAFSYRQIGDVLNLRNAAVHYYFPAKADLGESVIKEELQKMKDQPLDFPDLTGSGQLQLTVESFFKLSRSRLMCLTGSFAPEYQTFPEPLRHAVHEMCEDNLAWMTSCLEKGRLDGSLQFQGDPADRALLVMSSLMSSLLLSRVLGTAIFDRMIDLLLSDLGADWRISELIKNRSGDSPLTDGHLNDNTDNDPNNIFH